MDLDRLFDEILKPALGCTEPVAVALSAAAASQAALGWTQAKKIRSRISADDVRSIQVHVSKNIFKNGFAIVVPNAQGHKGLLMSAALGVFCNPLKSLRLLEDVDSAHVLSAERMVTENRIRVELNDEVGAEVYIRTKVNLGTNSGSSLIYREHSTIACLWRDDEVIEGDPDCHLRNAAYSPELEGLKRMSFRDLVALVNDLPAHVLALLQETKSKNLSACQAGVARPMGIGAGYFGSESAVPGDYSQHLSQLAAAGSDVRMSGYPQEIMTSAGSGNQGITATIPIVAYASAKFIDEGAMLKALALSHLITMYLTLHIGYLSAFCGVAIKSGIGAACGLTYLMGGTADDIERTLKIMAATLTGMICDGAKAGCALKVSTATQMATRAAVLAMNKAELPDDNGIIGASADETIRNLVILNASMAPVDQSIVQIMLAKIAQ